MDKTKQVDELRLALFDCLITQLRTEPTSAWARVARDVLADYDNAAGDEFNMQSKAALEQLKERAPFKLGKSG